MNPILICNNLVKRYSYQQALGGVNLTLERGTSDFHNMI